MPVQWRDSEPPADLAAAACHGFAGPICPPGPWNSPAEYTGHIQALSADAYHLGDRDELADERFEACKAEVRQSTLDSLRAGLAQMPKGRAGAVPADDKQILAALEDRMSCGRFLPAAVIVHAVRGDMTPLWRWIEEAFTQAAEEAADRVRWTR